MKKVIFSILLLNLAMPLFAASVGGPDMALPEEDLLKNKAVNDTLNRYDLHVDVKAAPEIEILSKKKLIASTEVTDAKIKGSSYMLKISNNFNNIIEPYIKIGTSSLEVRWNQNGNNIVMESKPGFVWGAGAKVIAWESKDYGVKLTLDAQYKRTDLDVDKIKLDGAEPAYVDDKFEIDEWQFSLLLSKRYILPLGLKDYYIVPYGGLLWCDSNVQVEFTRDRVGQLYSTYDASDDNTMGVVLGFDVMPSLLSWYLLNFEVRMFSETAFTLGGTIKF